MPGHQAARNVGGIAGFGSMIVTHQNCWSFVFLGNHFDSCETSQIRSEHWYGQKPWAKFYWLNLACLHLSRLKGAQQDWNNRWLILGCLGIEQASKELTSLPETEAHAELREAIFTDVQHCLHLLWAFSHADTAGLSDRSLRSYEKQE